MSASFPDHSDGGVADPATSPGLAAHGAESLAERRVPDYKNSPEVCDVSCLSQVHSRASRERERASCPSLPVEQGCRHSNGRPHIEERKSGRAEGKARTAEEQGMIFEAEKGGGEAGAE